MVVDVPARLSPAAAALALALAAALLGPVGPAGAQPDAVGAVPADAGAGLGADEAPRGASRGQPARVVRVVDGDTLWLESGRGTLLKLRLQGLDAPEICQAWGPEARDALHALVAGRTVWVRTRGRDDWGRRLGRIQDDDGHDLGAQLVAAGHAWSHRWRGQPGPYAAQEQAARARRLGLHADPDAQHPREFRRGHGSCYGP